MIGIASVLPEFQQVVHVWVWDKTSPLHTLDGQETGNLT